MEIEVLDHSGLRYYTNKYISTMNNDISKVEGDLVVTNQAVREIQTQLDDINSLVSKEVSSEISSIVSDIAKVTFQLDLKDMVNTSEMTHVIIDEIDRADAVEIISGTFSGNGVYI